jgi:hypothetical protein
MIPYLIRNIVLCHDWPARIFLVPPIQLSCKRESVRSLALRDKCSILFVLHGAAAIQGLLGARTYYSLGFQSFCVCGPDLLMGAFPCWSSGWRSELVCNWSILIKRNM